MAHVRFLDRFDYRVKAGVHRQYSAGWSGSVTRGCAEKAIAAGKAVKIPTPPRPKKATVNVEP